MNTYQGPACKRCGGTRWKKIPMPVFRVEECMSCHANRTTTDIDATGDYPPGSVVYVVLESWGPLQAGDIVGVFSNQTAAEQAAARKRNPARPTIRYVVQRHEVLGEPTDDS